MRVVSHSEADTARIAARLARTFRGGEVLLLEGDLGAGKTAFVRGLARALGVRGRITSPTFVLMREYRLRRGGASSLPVRSSPSRWEGEIEGVGDARRRQPTPSILSRVRRSCSRTRGNIALPASSRGKQSSLLSLWTRLQREGRDAAPPLRHLIHADSYRLRDPRELLHAGLAEWIGRRDAVIAVEWGERLMPLLRGVPIIRLRFTVGRTEHARTITIERRA